MSHRSKWAGRLSRRVALLLLTVWAALPAAAGAEAPTTWRLSFEVLSAQHAQPARPATYEEKEKLTAAVLAEVVPYVWTAVDTVAHRVRSRVRPGGYGTTVNPAIHSNLQIRESEGRKLAAALGYVFRQEAVLMYDLKPAKGEVSFVTVRFPRGTLTRERAEAFFARLRTVLGSDKLGFSALGSRFISLNIATGISDEAFLAGFRTAIADDPGLKLSPLAPARAFLIENDWEKSREGEDYTRIIGDQAAIDALKRLRNRFDGRVRRWAQIIR